MAKIKFYQNNDVYSDGDIENEILSLANEGFDITQGNDSESYPFAVAYHFSPIRENILCWYPFKSNASCLEIGAGCGAITGMLCQKCSDVVSVDISKRRCEINYARHKDIDGLEIIAGNIQTLDLGRKFDYVVLNGVFEYALSFIHTDTPYLSLMQLAKSFLKPNGKLFIAIENRLGLKYFNGAAEDHTDNCFLGLNQYDGNDSVRTFSKNELISLIKESGFKNYRFYYPYPDYKFPSEIFTDSTVNDGGYGSSYMNFNKHSFGLYSEQKVAKSFASEGVMDKFSNSFLVEISDDLCDETIDYVKINSLRKAEYGIMTVLAKGKNVYKLPLTENANTHIMRMHKNTDIYPDGIKGITSEIYLNSGGGLKYPFLKNKTLTEVINESNAKKTVSSNLKLFFGRFKTEKQQFLTEKFKAVFGDFDYKGELACISPANVDLICDNIFVDGNDYIVIDNEWSFDFAVPIQFIVWRNLNELYYKNPQLEEKEKKQSVFDTFGIDDEMCTAFFNWAVYFADRYVGNNYLLKYAIPFNEVSLLELYNARQAERVFSTSCYYDRGNGFGEEDKAFETIELDDKGNFCVTFPVPKDIVAFRWDIAEGMFLKCCIEKVSGGILTPDNASLKSDGYDIFYTTDPHYTLTDFGDKVVIQGKILPIDRTEIIKAFEQNAAVFMAKAGEYKATIDEQCEKINTAQKAIEVDKKYISKCEDRLKAYFEKQVELNLAIEDYQNQLANSIAETQRILNSRGVRLLMKIWHMKSKIMNRGR